MKKLGQLTIPLILFVFLASVGVWAEPAPDASAGRPFLTIVKDKKIENGAILFTVEPGWGPNALISLKNVAPKASVELKEKDVLVVKGIPEGELIPLLAKCIVPPPKETAKPDGPASDKNAEVAKSDPFAAAPGVESQSGLQVPDGSASVRVASEDEKAAREMQTFEATVRKVDLSHGFPFASVQVLVTRLPKTNSLKLKLGAVYWLRPIYPMQYPYTKAFAEDLKLEDTSVQNLLPLWYLKDKDKIQAVAAKQCGDTLGIIYVARVPPKS